MIRFRMIVMYSKLKLVKYLSVVNQSNLIHSSWQFCHYKTEYNRRPDLLFYFNLVTYYWKYIFLVQQEIRARVDFHKAPSPAPLVVGPGRPDTSYYDEILQRQAAEINELKKKLVETETDSQVKWSYWMHLFSMRTRNDWTEIWGICRLPEIGTMASATFATRIFLSIAFKSRPVNQAMNWGE